MTDTTASPLFASAAAALAFAFNFSMQQYDRPLMNRVAAGPGSGNGLGLVGNDGAAQAAMIQRRIATLTPRHQALLTTRFAPPTMDCFCDAPCCGGTRPNFLWQSGVRLVADAAEKEALTDCTINRALTLALVAKLFDKRPGTLAAIAVDVEVATNTASKHHARLRAWLYGDEWKSGRLENAGVDAQALAAAERVLREAGIVGRLDDNA
ncbi:hypothetical protein [Bordetella bronchiseptica]|uniref:hypothetical protein n=1 Tax=Bordetella bronchiseptica TaxID=518 RepID=UPI001249497E|nr:hypothetical protein [Bordetella bronchiseptica]KAB1444947.1 hypothetical protein F7D00_18710 [Bordetella bronchiseptica]KAB1571167.1 hypothetical protein F7890_18710 [Bordetella bronchiseptica]